TYNSYANACKAGGNGDGIYLFLAARLDTNIVYHLVKRLYQSVVVKQ
ncbi:8601_t:CDS:2, partial [Paraglomus occultum]